MIFSVRMHLYPPAGHPMKSGFFLLGSGEAVVHGKTEIDVCFAIQLFGDSDGTCDSHIQNTANMTVGQRQAISDRLGGVSQVSLCILYTDGSSQLREPASSVSRPQGSPSHASWTTGATNLSCQLANSRCLETH